jgi:F0F1-type ATP synthase membrane subunit b/b'
MMMNNKAQGDLIIFVGLGIIILLGVAILFAIGPIYNVWASSQNGQAELAKAQFSKQVAVQEAQAKLDSSKLLAEAEVERAKGAAQANQILGDSLKGKEEYLRYLYIQSLTDNPASREIVYIPTEAGIPILEAGKEVKQ